jgi:hypothetical protein
MHEVTIQTHFHNRSVIYKLEFDIHTSRNDQYSTSYTCKGVRFRSRGAGPVLTYIQCAAMSNHEHDNSDRHGLTPADLPPPLLAQNRPAPSPCHYTDINVLLQNIRDRDSDAMAYMAELNHYTEECERIKMEKQMNGDGPQNNTTSTRPPLVNTPTVTNMDLALPIVC